MRSWLRRELPAVLPVFILEKAGSDAERQSSSADQIDTRRDLGEMRGIAVTDRRAQGGKTDAASDSGQPRQDGPAFQDRLVGRAHAGDLDHVIHDREPDKAVIFRPPRFRLHRFERLGWVGTVEPGRVVNAELHGFQNPCDGMRNARLKREDAFSHAMIIVSSAMVSSS